MTHVFLSDTEYGRVGDDWVVRHRNMGECSGRIRERVCGVFEGVVLFLFLGRGEEGWRGVGM